MVVFYVVKSFWCKTTQFCGSERRKLSEKFARFLSFFTITRARTRTGLETISTQLNYSMRAREKSNSDKFGHGNCINLRETGKPAI